MTESFTVTGPLPGPVPMPVGVYDLDALGYVEEEFLLHGSARSFSLVGDRTADGRWDAEAGDTAPFTTRLLVRRPKAASGFSGTVVVEWFNVSGGLDAGPDWILLHRHLIRRGHAWVGVSAQKAGIDGGGLVEGMHLKKMAPDRYEPLAHPGDSWAYDIFTRAGQALRSTVGPSPLGPLTPTRLLAAGESQSAMFLVSYVNAVDPLAQTYDGFLVHGRGASGGPLDNGATDTAISEAVVRMMASPGEQIRADARVPVLVLQSETDVALLGGGRARQADSASVCLWEIAGAAHADTYILVAGAYDDGQLSPQQLAQFLQPTREVIGMTTGTAINSGPQQHYVGQAALEHLDRWAAGGSPPPMAARLDLTDDGSSVSGDARGIATGGLRTPWVDVPVAQLSGLGQTGETFAMLFGTTVAFEPESLRELYPGGRDEYVARFTVALDESI
ncbi:MAG: hypothetical protein JWL70_2774, partial [Acidimicrobiia bacterium]|nr:hypothetical protein [Acidimicrobiia bacterium]